jgi:LmbE family N-acetylglucosaminyl deacetylase
MLRIDPAMRASGWMVALVLLAPFAPGAPARAADELTVPPRLRLLVVAPHPDDESLGAGGLIQQTLAGGGRVHVLFMTNGDGYPEAVEVATGHREPSASDYRGFGELRRAEALVALEHYRVLPLSVTFLGFPDGGLAEIWRRGPQVPAYESPYTREDNPPYPHAFEASARYVSRDLIHLIARMVALSDPDWIALPTPLDNHPDHCATFTFVLAALKSLAAEAGGASKVPDRVLTYLVHGSAGWPPPSSVPGPIPVPSQVLEPARWYSLALTPDQVKTKLEALETHRTQAAVMDALFRSFARSNELFNVVERDQMLRMVPGTPPCGPELPSRASLPPRTVDPAAHGGAAPAQIAPTPASQSSTNGHAP